MSPELDKKLCEKYPKIFRDRHASIKQSCMAWGFDIGDGWYNIIDNACGLIQLRIDERRKDKLRDLKKVRRKEKLYDWEQASINVPKIQQVVANQIKEKFGSLRFYYSGGDDYVDGVVQMAESMSYDTCEVCGKPGKPKNEGWIKVRCESCLKDEQFGSEKL